MGSWAAVAFECRDSADRRRLLRWFERTQPVEFPVERYSVRAAIDAADGRRRAEYAWLGRYLHVVTTGDPRPVVTRAAETGHWRRTVVAELDGETETVVDGRLVRAADDPGAVDGATIRGVPGLAGLGLVYALAMRRQFRFRPCAARPPPDVSAPLLDAFTDPADVADGLTSFVRAMHDRTGVAPTADGREFLRSDPAGDDRVVHDGPGGRLNPGDGDEAGPAADTTLGDGPDDGVAAAVLDSGSSSRTRRVQTDGGQGRREESPLGRLRSLLR